MYNSPFGVQVCYARFDLDYKYLDIVIRVEGFQHGDKELTLKCLAISCMALSFYKQFQFCTNLLCDSHQKNLTIYQHQQALHGFYLMSPSESQQTRQTLRQSLCDIQLEFITLCNAPAPTLRLWAKGQDNTNFIRTLTTLTMGLLLRDLEEIGCPSLKTLPQSKWITPLSKARTLNKWLLSQDI